MKTRSPIMATALVMFFLIAVPVGLIRRFSDDELLPLRPFDIPLLVGLIAWLLVAKSIIDRGESINSVTNYRLSPRWQAHSLVEQSFFGVGFTSSRSIEPFALNQLASVSMPTDLMASQLPPVMHTEAAWADPARADDEPVPAIPTLRDEPAPLGFLATEEYDVQRRDTFWSLTAQVLGDGRQWKSIQALNIGREVAPGVIFNEGDELRIGWSILIPLVASDEEESEDA